MSFAPPVDATHDAVVSYAYSIRLNDIEIGAIQRFTPSSSRAAERIREIRASSGNKTLGLIPNREDVEATLERVTLFRKGLEKYFGEGRVPSAEVFFASIRGGVDIIEQQFTPAANAFTPPSTVNRQLKYSHCVPNAWSKTIDNGTTMVTESVTVTVGDIVKVSAK